MYESNLDGIFEDEMDWDFPLTHSESFPVLEEVKDYSKSNLIRRIKEKLNTFDEQLDEHIANINVKINKMRRGIAGHTYNGEYFTAEQYSELLRAKEFGVDPGIIADPEYLPEQMRLVAEAAGAGYKYEFYNPGMDIHKLTLLNTFQMLAPEYDVVRLSNLPADKIKVILKGYMEGIDIRGYAMDYTADQLEEILLCREKGLDVANIGNAALSAEQMGVLIEHMDLGIDVSGYNRPEYSVDQMDDAAYVQLRERDFMGTVTKDDDRVNPNIIDKARHSVFMKSAKYYNPEHNNRIDREEAALRMYQGMKLQTAMMERNEVIQEKTRLSI